MKNFFTALSAVILLLAACCKKENTAPMQYAIPANLMMIDSGYAPGAAMKVAIYAANNLFVGYNPLYIALYDSASNKRISQAQISLNPMMNMSGMSQSCPAENPPGTNADNGLFNTAVVFVTPTGSTCKATLATQVRNIATGGEGGFVSTVDVVQPTPAKEYSVITTDDSASLFVSIVQPANPQIGANDFEITIQREINAMSFVPDSSYTVMINPVMPAMAGMTSPNNVNPVHVGNGHYAGKINFTMSGAWQININLMHNGVVADTSHYFDINLE